MTYLFLASCFGSIIGLCLFDLVKFLIKRFLNKGEITIGTKFIYKLPPNASIVKIIGSGGASGGCDGDYSVFSKGSGKVQVNNNPTKIETE